MSKQNAWTVVVGAGLMCLAMMLSGSALAQDAGTPGGAPGGDRATRGGRGGTPEEMQKRIEEWRNRGLEMAREQLGFTEDEWAQVKPMYEKVSELSRQVNRPARMMGMAGGRNRRGGDNNAQGADRPATPRPEDATPLGQARLKLDEALRDAATPATDVKVALDAYRAAKLQAQKELDQARADLRSILSVRQEAMLVASGMLD